MTRARSIAREVKNFKLTNSARRNRPRQNHIARTASFGTEKGSKSVGGGYFRA